MGVGNGGGSVCIKIILIIINIIFGIIGFVLAAGGAFLFAGQKVYGSFIESLTNELPSLIESSGLSGAKSNNGSTLDLSGLISGAAIVLLVIGLFLFAMSILACIGVCCDVRIVLIVYCVIMVVLTLAQIVLLGLYASGEVDKYVDKTFLTMIEKKYGGIDDYSTESLLLNVLMIQFKCCGAHNYKDFEKAEKWEKVRNMTIQGNTVSKTLITPIACCKFDGSFPNVKITNDDCAWAPTDLNNNWNKGCTQEVLTYLGQYQNIVLGGLAGIIVFQIILIILIIVLLKLTKSKVDVA